jgi:putative membrane protein
MSRWDRGAREPSIVAHGSEGLSVPEIQSSPRAFEVRLTSDSHFSWLRTTLSLERTLMSWVRTATALIGFGFTIVQFFDRFPAASNTGPELQLDIPHYFGVALIGAGVIALLISVWQYVWVKRYLWSEPFVPIAGARQGGMQTPILAVAILLTVIGVLTFGAVVSGAV